MQSILNPLAMVGDECMLQSSQEGKPCVVLHIIRHGKSEVSEVARYRHSGSRDWIPLGENSERPTGKERSALTRAQPNFVP